MMPTPRITATMNLKMSNSQWQETLVKTRKLRIQKNSHSGQLSSQLNQLNQLNQLSSQLNRIPSTE